MGKSKSEIGFVSALILGTGLGFISQTVGGRIMKGITSLVAFGGLCHCAMDYSPTGFVLFAGTLTGYFAVPLLKKKLMIEDNKSGPKTVVNTNITFSPDPKTQTQNQPLTPTQYQTPYQQQCQPQPQYQTDPKSLI